MSRRAAVLSCCAVAAAVAIAPVSFNTGRRGAAAPSAQSSRTVATAAGTSSGPQARGADYSPVSPHWPHIRLHVTDYRIHYQPKAQRPAEYEWVARHFDRILLDRQPVAEYRRVNPGAEMYSYALNWTVLRPGEYREPDPAMAYYPQMVEWYRRHTTFRLEDAFLHDRGRCGTSARKTEDCRVTFKIWTQMRWAVNPRDPGLRAFQRERMAMLATSADGLFLDEHSSGDIRDKLDVDGTLEYGDWRSYERDMLTLLRELRAALGPRRRLMLNTAAYLTPFDSQMAVAAGGAHVEDFNNAFFPEMEKRWRFAESLIAAGVAMTVSPVEPEATPRQYTSGNSATPLDRRRLWELGSYYLIAPPTVGAVAFSNGAKWKRAFPEQWWKAVEFNVGRPKGQRRVYAEGRDPSGRRYRVWGREYERALVLVRPVIEWGRQSFGDETAVQVRVPSGPHVRPLSADGRIGAPVARITLRASEAAILVSEGGGR